MNLELQILFVIKKKFPLIILGDLVQICSYSIRYFHVPRAKCSWRKCLYLWNHCASFANFSKYNAQQYGHWRYFGFNIFSRWSNQSISSSRSKCCFFFSSYDIIVRLRFKFLANSRFINRLNGFTMVKLYRRIPACSSRTSMYPIKANMFARQKTKTEHLLLDLT